MAGADHIEDLESLLGSSGADVTQSGVLSQRGKPAALVEMFRRGDVDDGSRHGASDVEFDAARGNEPEIEAQVGHVAAIILGASFVAAHLLHGIGDDGGIGDLSRH